MDALTSVRQHTYKSSVHRLMKMIGENLAERDVPSDIATRHLTMASYGLLLLSRINGDAPALMTARRLDDSRAG
jgi:hypothetical protein